MTRNPETSPAEVSARLAEAAEGQSAHAVGATRFDHSDTGGTWTGIAQHGTAVRVAARPRR